MSIEVSWIYFDIRMFADAVGLWGAKSKSEPGGKRFRSVGLAATAPVYCLTFGYRGGVFTEFVCPPFLLTQPQMCSLLQFLKGRLNRTETAHECFVKSTAIKR